VSQQATGRALYAILTPVVLVLGRAPAPLTVLLTPGADFTTRIRVQRSGVDEPWPDGTTLTLGIQANPRGIERRWPFTITGSTATVVIPEADVNGLLGQLTPQARARLWLDYGDANGRTPEGEFLWASGEVQIRG
jgi:hypothetical protein